LITIIKMFILGLNIGHNATACLLKDGKIVGCVSEERFSRLKNHIGIPFKSIDFLMSSNKIDISLIDYVVLDNQYPVYNDPNSRTMLLNFYTKKNAARRLVTESIYKFPNAFDNYKKLKDRIFLSSKIKVKINKLKEEISFI